MTRTHTPPRILLVRLSALGDVLQTLPVLTALKTAYPQAQLGWLVEADAAPILENHPQLDFLHISHRKRWLTMLKNPLEWGKVLKEAYSLLQEIKVTGYDIGLDFQGLLKSAVTLYFTGIQRRIGFACAREGSSVFYTERVPVAGDFFNPATPILNHFMTLASALGTPLKGDTGMMLPKPAASAINEAGSLLAALPETRPIVALAPATMWQSKHWPCENWALLIEQLLQGTKAWLLLVGSPADRALADAILRETKISADTENRLFNITGQTSLSALQIILEKADAVIGPDSAPIHLAGAVGKAFVLGLYGPTGYRRSPPPGSGPRVFLSSENELSCQPCDAKVCPLGTTECMKRITVDQVFETLITQFPSLGKEADGVTIAS